MKIKKTYRDAWNTGWTGGLVSLSIAALGLAELFEKRNIVSGILTMGQVMVFIVPLVMAYIFTKDLDAEQKKTGPMFGAVIGAVTAIPLILLTYLSTFINIRNILVNVSPKLIAMLSLGQENVYLGGLLLLFTMTALSFLSAYTHQLPEKIKRSLFTGIFTIILVGMFSEILSERIRTLFGALFGMSAGSAVVRFLFKSKAIQVLPALVIFLIALYVGYTKKPKKEKDTNSSKRGFIVDGKIQWKTVIPIAILLLILPLLLGKYLSEVTSNVGIYILMGLGLNIVVGFAGLLDLGYVAFFAIGAYTMAVLTSTGPLGLFGMNFWIAIPICVLVAALAGVMLGIPVLRMRGDYLAIVTLGFGEIISRLAISDMLKPYIGGAQGILQIPKPNVGGIILGQPQQMYYVILAGVLLALFVSWRLRDSRLGRQWMAMREDEDVAEAMGINLMKTKILAFSIGAAFSGLAGAIFASKLTTIFPHSFSLLISINVLSLIIVGGIGSLPGVVVGAAILIGLPELLREFAEYRLLMYGILLIAMMLAKPEGFVPSEIHKRELHAADEELSAEAAD